MEKVNICIQFFCVYKLASFLFRIEINNRHFLDDIFEIKTTSIINSSGVKMKSTENFSKETSSLLKGIVRNKTSSWNRNTIFSLVYSILFI